MSGQFEWLDFLTRNGIEYVEQGPNVARNNVNIHCPWCGADDPSHHLGISLNGSGWGCWRNPSHRGKSRAKLIQALLGCSSARARELAGAAPVADRPAPQDLASLTSRNLGRLDQAKASPRQRLDLHPSFKPLRDGGLFANRFYDYLLDRGYRFSEVEWLIDKYELHYATSGPWGWRLVLPIRDEDGVLKTWTARAIRRNSVIRYKTLALDPEDPNEQPALDKPGNLLLGLQMLWAVKNPRRLVVVEGPLDATRVSVLGHERGVYGTCLFGLNLSTSQADLIENLSRRFADVVLLMDPGAHAQALRALRSITVPIRSWTVPKGVEDPGALRKKEAEFLYDGL